MLIKSNIPFEPACEIYILAAYLTLQVMLINAKAPFNPNFDLFDFRMQEKGWKVVICPRLTVPQQTVMKSQHQLHPVNSMSKKNFPHFTTLQQSTSTTQVPVQLSTCPQTFSAPLPVVCHSSPPPPSTK